MVLIESSIDKTVIPGLPQVVFDGSIEVIDTPEAAEEAVKFLLTQKVTGFDTETKPAFKKGIINKPALLQVSSHDRAFLFRLNKIGMPDSVRSFLESPDVIKVGLSVNDDFRSLGRRGKFVPSSFVELQSLAGEMGIEEKGLQRLYALLFGQRISKNQQLSNWECDELSDGQKQYAAIDAWACIGIYEYLNGLRLSGDYEIIRRNAEEGNTEKR